MCASGQLVIAVDKYGEYCGLQKILGGTFTVEEIGAAMKVNFLIHVSIVLDYSEF